MAVPVVDKEACVRCGGCISGYDGSNGCPQKAIEMKDDGAHINPERCLGCGKCAALCGLGAIAV